MFVFTTDSYLLKNQTNRVTMSNKANGNRLVLQTKSKWISKLVSGDTLKILNLSFLREVGRISVGWLLGSSISEHLVCWHNTCNSKHDFITNQKQKCFFYCVLHDALCYISKNSKFLPPGGENVEQSCQSKLDCHKVACKWGIKVIPFGKIGCERPDVCQERQLYD